MEKTLTVEEVAERLKVQPITIRRAIRRGELRSAFLGRGYRIFEADLERWQRYLLSAQPASGRPRKLVKT